MFNNYTAGLNVVESLALLLNMRRFSFVKIQGDEPWREPRAKVHWPLTIKRQIQVSCWMCGPMDHQNKIWMKFLLAVCASNSPTEPNVLPDAHITEASFAVSHQVSIAET